MSAIIEPTPTPSRKGGRGKARNPATPKVEEKTPNCPHCGMSPGHRLTADTRRCSHCGAVYLVSFDVSRAGSLRRVTTLKLRHA